MERPKIEIKHFGKLTAIYYDDGHIEVGFIHGKNGLKSNAKTYQQCIDLAIKIANETNKSINTSYWKATDEIFIK